MKTHFCLEENTTIDFEGECNWCGEKEWQGLSDDEIQNVCGISKDGNYWDLCLDIARAIEQALKEKNA